MVRLVSAVQPPVLSCTFPLKSGNTLGTKKRHSELFTVGALDVMTSLSKTGFPVSPVTVMVWVQYFTVLAQSV